MQEGGHVQPLVIGRGDCRQLVSWCEGVSMQHPTECCSAAVLQAPGQPQQGPQCVVSRLLQELPHQHVAILPGLGLHLQQRSAGQ